MRNVDTSSDPLEILINANYASLPDGRTETLRGYMNAGEYQMALEGLFLDLFNLPYVNLPSDKNSYIRIAKEWGLNLKNELVFDVDFWSKFIYFLNDKPLFGGTTTANKSAAQMIGSQDKIINIGYRVSQPDWWLYDLSLPYYSNRIDGFLKKIVSIQKDVAQAVRQMPWTNQDMYSEFARFQCLLHDRGVDFTTIENGIKIGGLLLESLNDIELRNMADGFGSKRENWSFHYRLSGWRWDFYFVALVLLLVRDPEELTRWMKLVSHGLWSTYVADTLVKAFVPDRQVLGPREYIELLSSAGERLEAWNRPHMLAALQAALATPGKDGKEAALAQYMARWNQMMEPHGWKAQRHYTDWPDLSQPRPPGSDAPFFEWASEVALAVCAWDLDDSAFRSHPYYPRDLVDHYRAHVRHTRDAWRADGIGPDFEVEPPLAA